MNSKNKNSVLIGSISLLIASFLWGMSYSAQKLGAGTVAPFAFTGVRNLLGALSVLPMVLIRLKKGQETKVSEGSVKTLLIAGLLAGFCLFWGLNFLGIGVQYTSVGKAGFISALYIFVVPFVAMIRGDKPGRRIWISVAIAIVGFYFLCLSDGFSIGKGDLIVIFSMLGFASHILVLGQFSKKVDGVKLSCLQFFVCGVLSLIVSFVIEDVTIVDFYPALIPLLYAGIISTGVGFTLQTLGQAKVTPARASLILSMESIFSALGGYFILHDSLTFRELIGCAIVFFAVILSQTGKSDN